MKGLLVACLVLTTFAGTTDFFGFFDGFRKGLDNAQHCAENPVTCGRRVGNVMSLLAPSPIVHTRETLGSLPSPTDVQAFITGITTGLRYTNATQTPCVSIFNRLSYGIQSFYANILSFRTSIQPLDIVNGVCQAYSFYSLNYGQCDFPALWTDIENLTFGTLWTNYFAHMCPLDDGFANVVNCMANYEQCGFGIGLGSVS